MSIIDAMMMRALCSNNSNGSSDKIVVLSETELEFEWDDEFQMGQAYPQGNYDVQDGQMFTVQWNGSEYHCVAHAIQFAGTEQLLFGNVSLLASVLGLEVPDTGEPFLVVYTNTDGFLVISKDTQAIVEIFAYPYAYSGTNLREVNLTTLPLPYEYAELSSEESKQVELALLFGKPIMVRFTYLVTDYNGLFNLIKQKSSSLRMFAFYEPLKKETFFLAKIANGAWGFAVKSAEEGSAEEG